VGQEVLELAPAIADLDASPAVPVEVARALLSASANHRAPACVSRRATMPVSRNSPRLLDAAVQYVAYCGLAQPELSRDLPVRAAFRAELEYLITQRHCLIPPRWLAYVHWRVPLRSAKRCSGPRRRPPD